MRKIRNDKISDIISDKIASRIKEIKTESYLAASRIAAGDATLLTRGDKIAIVVTSLFTIFALVAFSNFCYADGIIEQAQEKAQAYYGKLFGLTTFAAALAVLIALIWAALAPTADGARTPLAWVKRIIVCYFVILCLGGLFGLIQDITKNQGFN